MAAAPSPWPEPADRVDQFVARFGNEAYRSLAYHAALPLVLTPELVHYLRIQCLRADHVPWEAEVDLLLSDLCRQVGYELYTMDTQVRAYLLAEIKDDPVWQHRLQEVAQVLISYVSYLSRVDPQRRPRELEAQRLAAMTYLGDEHCQAAVQDIGHRFQHLADQARAEGASDQSIRAELAYLSRITQELAPQLTRHPELVELAQLVQRLLRHPEAVTPADRARTFRVGDADIRPSVFPLRFSSGEDETTPTGMPPLRTLEFETGQFVQPEAGVPALEAQTVEVVTLEFEEANTDSGPISGEPTLVLGVYGWDKVSETKTPNVELDWQEYCDRTTRQVPTPDTWDSILFPQLQQAKQTLIQISSSRYIYLLGNCPLTMSLAIGFTFPYVAGYKFRLKQFTGGEMAFWESSASPSEAQLEVIQEQGTGGSNLIFAIGISVSIWKDVQQFQERNQDQFNALVYAEPKQGTGQRTLKSDKDAVALALHAKELMHLCRQKYEAESIHLIFACPAAFSLFLGQRLNALGLIMAYERTQDGSYQISVILRTG
ncbi:hypothetical protein XM38_036890 [Halomicronema hongdechloris C2206]|uniref:SMODS-associated and fused to various effectors domain-containing protein n=1 Tax=Halomicronema hongdechloris C2206 TaxID=1641165 RepID=A0A1Z3HQZ7_9CYAN|nr:SAVED domain-containing protein [Halomicronema hongdechloris]ASC72731.1 hypothetical protein XM38_036890 [Halomicronema hongdechloris C2206]